MSQIYSRLYFFGYEKTDSVPQLAWSLAERAARLEPELFAASKAKAEYYYRCRRDYGKSLAEWDKAAQDNKANDLQYLWQTHHILRRAGRFQDAYDRLRRACDLDPADAFKKMDLSATCMAMRRYSEAGQLLNEVILKEPDFENGYEGKAELALYAYGDIAAVREVIHQSEGKVDQSRWDQFASYFDVLEGRYDKALLQVPPIEDDSAAYYRQCARIYDYKSDTLTMRAYADSALPGTERRAAEAPLDPQAQADLGIVYAELGRKADAIAAGKRGLEALTVQDDAIQGPAGIQNLIIIYGLVGEVDSAMAQFEYLMSIPFNFTPAYVVIDPDFAPLTKHPRFATVAARGGKVF